MLQALWVLRALHWFCYGASKGSCEDGHLGAAQSHNRQQAAAAALEDGAHSAEQPLLAALPGQVIGHSICRLHHHCSTNKQRVSTAAAFS